LISALSWIGRRTIKSDIGPLFESRQGVDHGIDFCFDDYGIAIYSDSLYVTGIRLHNRVRPAVSFKINKVMDAGDFTYSVPADDYTVVGNDFLIQMGSARNHKEAKNTEASANFHCFIFGYRIF
jgi:hypothetical protein